MPQVQTLVGGCPCWYNKNDGLGTGGPADRKEVRKVVDLKAKPFYLTEEDIAWVRSTIAGMTDEEKVGQLFFFLGGSRDEEYLRGMVQRYHVGGARYNPGTAQQIYEQNRILQESAKIPLLIAANTESGGDGACSDGTCVGMPVKIGATGDERYAYEMGRIGNLEAAAVGCNISFAPLVDIHQNWQNPVVSNRCFSSQADTVLKMGLAYFRGAHQAAPFACAAKHFPGDGLDFRDQHIANSVNTASCEEWDATYGKVYQGLIDEGLEAIMAGHIMQPAYTRYFNPGIADGDILPGTLSKELLTDLLRGKLGFNGMIVTDATHMVGMTSRMKRSDMVPAAIAAGCDMFLFFNDPREDIDSMLAGYRSGVITEQRLQDALERILGLKARLGLHKKAPEERMPPREQLGIVGCAQHKAMAHEVAEKAVTLVKSKQEGVLPLTPKKYPHISIVPVKGLEAPGLPTLYRLLLPEQKGPEIYVKELLEARGFEVDILESEAIKLLRKAQRGEKPDVNAYFMGKISVESFTSGRDLVITLADVSGGMQTVERVAWSITKGGGEIPWYVHELPVVVVSLGYPFMLADVPQARTYINAYDAKPQTLAALVEKLCGETAFEGKDPVDSFCGLWDTRL